MSIEMTPEVHAKLRAPFPPEAVGKLPRVTCGACSKKQCQQHQRQKCRICNAYVSTQHIHLDFVGHAEVTDRFLQVDPEWTWEPMALTQDGLPAMDRHGGMWIRLTIAGVTRLGYGHADGKDGPDAVKEIIGDGLRNAGMRFGVGLDLWGAHGGGANPADDSGQPERPAAKQASPKAGEKPAEQRPLDKAAQDRREAWSEAWESAKALGMSREEFSKDFSAEFGVPERDGTVAQLRQYAQQQRQAAEAGKVPAA